MKSVRSKILLLILTGIIVSVTMIGGVGFLSFRQTLDEDSVKIMNLTCDEKARELNSILDRIEQSVRILSVYAYDNVDSIESLSDEDNLAQYIQYLSRLVLTVVNETDGVVSGYIRVNAEISAPMAGVYKAKCAGSDSFVDWELTDISMYGSDDVGHAGWYYQPVNAGRAVWMSPYYNESVDIYMISYVVPVYKDGVLLCVVGMDIDFNYISDKVDDIRVYDTGYAFLIDDNFEIIHSKNYEKGTLIKDFKESVIAGESEENATGVRLYDYTFDGVEKKLAFRTLDNGMKLAVTVPVLEIDSNSNKLLVRMLVIVALAVIVFTCIAWGIARTIVNPLKELNTAAREIADGNLDVILRCRSKDEVGTLAESLKETAHQLKKRIDYINSLAYVDKLTGIMNNTAYMQAILEINDRIRKGRENFAVFVIDVNGLKHINDTYGHDYGNKLLITAAKTIADVFGYENTYRIGGDEFAVIMKKMNEEVCGVFIHEFERKLDCQTGKVRVVASVGGAVYDKNSDNQYESVFKRADAQMYEKKQIMKSQGKNSTVII